MAEYCASQNVTPELTPQYGDLIGHGHGYGDGGIHVGPTDVSECFNQNRNDETHGEGDLDDSRVVGRITPVQGHRALYGDEEKRRYYLQKIISII